MDQCNTKVTVNNTDVELHSAYYKYKNEDVALIYLDLSDRHFQIFYTGFVDHPVIGIENPDEGNSVVEISFEDFDENWIVFSCELCKYTVAVTLYRNKDDNN